MFNSCFKKQFAAVSRGAGMDMVKFVLYTIFTALNKIVGSFRRAINFWD